MELADLVTQVADFDTFKPREKIRLFAWFLHARKNIEILDNVSIRACYRELHLQPDEVNVYTKLMMGYASPDLIKEKNGFKLARSIRTELDKKYGVHQSVVQTSKLLFELRGNIPDLAEQNFLNEAIKCYQIAAFRACIVMTWNLTFSHVLHWILKDPTRLADFNIAISKRYPKKANLTISKYDDFGDELTEREVVEICSKAGLMNSGIIKILREKLDKRNTAAHPSSVAIVQSQADDAVTDLVNNVVLALT